VGVEVCDGGRFRCNANVTPSPEVCNGLDEDCDGVVDGAVCGCNNGVSNVLPQATCPHDAGRPPQHVGACAEVELHFVAQFNTAAPVTEVRISRTGVNMSLVLSSYQSTQWRLLPEPGVQIEQVILNGAIRSSLIDPQLNVEVINRTGEGNNLTACAYDWPRDELGCDTPTLIAQAEMLTGLTITSFQGCYSGGQFSIGTQPE
jgi:hypothetical protein